MKEKSSGVLHLFPSLADRSVAKRVNSAKQFVKELQIEEIEEEKRKQDVDYCIDRFIKGNLSRARSGVLMYQPESRTRGQGLCKLENGIKKKAKSAQKWPF